MFHKVVSVLMFPGVGVIPNRRSKSATQMKFIWLTWWNSKTDS